MPKNPADMTEREMLEEIVSNMRAVNDAIETLAQHPMVAGVLAGQNPMSILMGR